MNRYGGTQRDRAAAIPAVQPYRHLDVVNQYDSVADRPARWGWYSQRELSLSRHLAYDDIDINDPANLVYRDGNTTYMLVPAKELRQLRGLRFLRDIGWVTPERYDEIDAERRARIEADYDRPTYVAQGPGADWANGVEPEVLRDNEEESWSEPLADTGSASDPEAGASTTLGISDGSDKPLDESASSETSKTPTHSRRTSKPDDAETETLSEVNDEPGRDGGNEQSEGAEPSSGAKSPPDSADQDTPADSAESEGGEGE